MDKEMNIDKELNIIKAVGLVVTVFLAIVGFNFMGLRSVAGTSLAEAYYQLIGWVVEGLALFSAMFTYFTLRRIKMMHTLNNYNYILTEQNKEIISILSEKKTTK